MRDKPVTNGQLEHMHPLREHVDSNKMRELERVESGDGLSCRVKDWFGEIEEIRNGQR